MWPSGGRRGKQVWRTITPPGDSLYLGKTDRLFSFYYFPLSARPSTLIPFSSNHRFPPHAHSGTLPLIRFSFRLFFGSCFSPNAFAPRLDLCKPLAGGHCNCPNLLRLSVKDQVPEDLLLPDYPRIQETLHTFTF